jgi:hypothetical protein
MTTAGDAGIRDRQSGGQRTGTVGLRDFDKGVVETLGAVVKLDENNQPNYWLMALRGVPLTDLAEVVNTPPGMPGIPVTFAFPEDIYEHWRKPGIIVSRDDASPAMQRYHPGAMQYNAPAKNARPVVVSGYGTGFSSMETLSQAVPFDLSYTINIITAGSRNNANLILDHVLRIFPPYAAIYVTDSVGDQRTYSAWMDGVAMLDELADVSERTIGFAVTLRVEAEFDLTDPEIRSTVTGRSTVNMQRK